TTAATLGSRRGGFSTWHGWNCNRRASDPCAWIRLNIHRSTEEVVDCCLVAFVRLGWRCIWCLCNYSAACKRRAPRFAQLLHSCADRYGNHGSRRLCDPPWNWGAVFEAAFVRQAILTLLCSFFRARRSCISRRSRFAPLSASN